MQNYALEISDFCCEQYMLLGIHTPLSNYKLAYLLNKQLNTHFKKANYELESKQLTHISYFPVFEFYEKKLDNYWFLIANTFKETRKNTTGSLFEQSTTKTHLIAEKKKVDYFLKIEGNYTFIRQLLNNIKQIPQIETCYQIDIDTLKSKENLIF